MTGAVVFTFNVSTQEDLSEVQDSKVYHQVNSRLAKAT